MHHNHTADNIASSNKHTDLQSPEGNNWSSSISTDTRRKRMGQIYGPGVLRQNLSSAGSSATSVNTSGHTVAVPSVPTSSLAQMRFSSRTSSSTSVRSASGNMTSFTSAVSMPPPPQLPENPQSNINMSTGLRQSTSNPNLFEKIQQRRGSQPAGRRTNALPPLDTRNTMYESDSAPPSAATTTCIRDLVTPPTPVGTQSEPSSPYSPSFSMPKLFGKSNKSRSGKSSNYGSRSSSPSLANRISSRISSGLSSRFGSRMSSRSNSPAISGMSASTTDLPSSSVTSGVDDNFPEFIPRRGPKPEVVAEIGFLSGIHEPLVDIDISCRQAPLNASKMSLNEADELEILGFMARGVYYYQPGGGSADEDGNYVHEVGEHIGYRYRVESLLGRGSFGTVLKCRDFKSGRMVAVKVTANRKEIHGQAKIEANMLRALMAEHNGRPELHHFLRLVEHFKFRGHFCIATELLGPNLYELLRRNKYEGLEENSVRYISRQLCEGLEFLADQKIIHCDLKPENILVSDIDQCQVKIVDFGSGCYEGRKLYTYIQSRFYRAPEILLGMPYGFSIDMWSLGAIIPELLTGKALFPSVDETDQIALMAQVIGRPDFKTLLRCTRAGLFFDSSGNPLTLQNSKGESRGLPGTTPINEVLSEYSPETIDFVEKVLEWSPEKRIDVHKAVFHPFVLGH